jgi:RHS repeat-associated protein
VTAPTVLVYLRARMLDPAPGRLLSADPVQPNAPGTQGFHRYSYTANNPTSWTDPTGNVTLVERAVVTGISSTLAGAGIGASIGWFTCGGLSGNLDLACLLRETAAGAAGGAVAAIPGVGILGGLGVAGGAGVAESLVRQGMQGGIDPLQVGIDGMLSAATFGIARHTLGPLFQRIRGAHLTNQAGPLSIQPGTTHLPTTPTAGMPDDVVGPSVRYNRATHYGGAQTNSPAARALREGAEGTACPSCGRAQVSGTNTAPVPEHSPSLLEHYYGGGYAMTDAQRRAYARSAEAFDGTLCLTCQRSQGGSLSQLSRWYAKLWGL